MSWRKSSHSNPSGSCVEVSELARGGAPAPVSRDELAHLAADWDAQAAQIERRCDPDSPWWRKAYALRECAVQLRDRIGLDRG